MSEDVASYRSAPIRLTNTVAPRTPLPPMSEACEPLPEPAAPTMAPMRYEGRELEAYVPPAPEPQTPGEAQLAADMARLQQAIDEAYGGYRDKDGHVRTYRTPDEWAALNTVVAEAVKDSRFREATGQPFIPREILREPVRRRIPPAVDRRLARP